MDLLKKCLEKVVDHSSKTAKEQNGEAAEDEAEYFLTFYRKWKNDRLELIDSTYKAIPRFYNPLATANEETLPVRLREDARSLFLQHQGQLLLNSEELKNMCLILDKKTSLLNGEEQQYLNYLELSQVMATSSQKCKKYFTPSIFAQLLQNDPAAHNKVGIVGVLNYVMRKTWTQQSRIGLSLYDTTGLGYLKECDLENYISELIPNLPQLDGLEKSFHSFYVCTAVRKFLFFLDPLHTGKIKVQDILTSSFLDDLLELRDEELPKDAQEANWFSAPSALRVYGQYLNLDSNHNGMLTKNELAELGSGTLTYVFVERVFQECLTYEGEMDYKTYLDLVLALENRHEPQALHYLFKILDVKGQGYLDTFSLNYFFRAIREQMLVTGQEPISFEDVRDEVFDMIKPVDSAKITLQDLLNSGHGEILVNILIDLNGFWTHENRDARPVEEPSEI
ncbi:phosphatase 2A regulatory subunit B'' subunit [Nesidiocoris tenuis]|uniref:Serine/threonine-protein phosphatase 2A regulatory subunit B'' subunit gamma n=1 Tax=Nesidiocoris tenuis TaxID=355587 RepID=A0ABN7AJF3_9HEMI|nr:phosphatase 2A regulatory subunit B'' subunit [Nesidiocoris tenuis]